MSIVYWSIEDSVADDKNVPHVYVGTRKNGRKWKWIVDVDGIYIDLGGKQKISEEGISKIFEKAREIDSEAQTPDSAKWHSDREEIWSIEKNRSQSIFRLLMREKQDAIELADFIAEVIEDEFDVEVKA